MKNQTNQVAQTKLQINPAKNYFATLILVLGLFFSFTESGVAQWNCPTGWTQTSRSFNYTAPGSSTTCTITIEFCFKCGITGPHEFRVDTYAPENSECYAIMRANFLDLQKKANDFVASIINEVCEVPPCGNNVSYTQVMSPLCVKWYHTPITHKMVGIACDDTPYCIDYYTNCLNYNYTPPRLVTTYNSSGMTGSPSCPIYSPTPQFPLEGEYSDCFRTGCGR